MSHFFTSSTRRNALWVLALAFFSFISFGSPTPGSLTASVVDFNSAQITIEDTTTSGQTLSSGSDRTALFKITFNDVAGMGDLSSLQLRLSGSATFTNGNFTSSFLEDLPDGVQAYKDRDGGGQFDANDYRTTFAPVNYGVEGDTATLSLTFQPGETLTNGAVYFVVVKTDNNGVTDGTTFQLKIPANGIVTSVASPTNTQVETNTLTMSASTPKVTRIRTNGSLSSAGTQISIDFDQSLNPDALQWAFDSNAGNFDAASLVYAENPSTWVAHSLGTNATANFSQSQLPGDRLTITLGNGATVENGDQLWISVPGQQTGAYAEDPAILDTTPPQLMSAYLVTDIGNDGAATQSGDRFLFTFSEPMELSTLDAVSLGSRLILSAGTLSTTQNPSTLWISDNVLEVTLTSAQTNSVGSTVSLHAAVKDLNGNAATNPVTLPVIQVVSVQSPSYVWISDNDTSAWGISNEDITAEWGAVAGADHYNIYLLPEGSSLDLQSKLNSSPIPGASTTFIGTSSTYSLQGDSRSNFTTFDPYYYFDSNTQYIAYVVACNDVAETDCSLATASNGLYFTNEDSFSSNYATADYMSTLGWSSTFVESTSPWNWSTIPTNQKVFAMVFSDPMDASTITTGTLTMTSNGTPVTGTVSYQASEWIAYFNVTDSFTAGADLVFSLAGALDETGMSISHTANFTVGTTVDSTAPSVIWTTPSESATGVNTMQAAIQIGFDEALDPTTIQNNLTIAPAVTGTLWFDPWANAVVFELNNAALQADMTYTVTVESNGIRDASGNALSADDSYTFTTGAADTSVPEVSWTSFNPEGFDIGFSVPMKESTVTTANNYTLTCDSAPVSLSAATFEWDSYEKKVLVTGVQLTEGDSCTLTLSASIKALNNNAVAEANRTQTGSVESHRYGDDYFTDFSNSADGGWYEMSDGWSGETYDDPMIQMWNPMNGFPDVNIAGVTTSFMIEFPITQTLQDNYKIDVVWPTGFDMDSVTFDANDFANRDINDWNDGTPTISAVSNNVATRTTTLTVDTAGAIGAEGDQLRFHLSNVGNASTVSSQYNLQVTTKDASGGTVEGPLTLSPFWLNEAGNGSTTVTVLDQDTNAPISGVNLSFYSSAYGDVNLTTDVNGQAAVTGIPVNSWGTDASVWMDGNEAPDGYIPNWGSLYFYLTEATPTATGTLYLDAADFTLTGTLTHAGIGTDGSTKVNVWTSGPNSWVQKTVTLEADGATAYTVPIGSAGFFNVGVDKFYDYQSGSTASADFIPPPPQMVQVEADDSSVTLNMTLEAADKTVSGSITDQNGRGISGTWVNVSSDQEKSDQWFWNGTSTDKQGNYSVAVGTGTFMVEAYIPGIAGNFKKTVVVTDADSTIDVDFVLKKPDLSISGTVSDGSNGIEWGNVSCRSTNGEFANAMTDSSGDYTILVNAGTYTCEAWAFDFGMVPAATGVDATDFVVSANASDINFTYDPDAFVQITGTLKDSGGTAMPYVWLWVDRFDATANNFQGYVNGGVTGSDGTFTLRVPKTQAGEEYILSMWDWQYGSMTLADADDINASSSDVNLGIVSLPEVQTVTVTAAGVPSNVDRLFINVQNEDTGTWSWGDMALTSGAGSTTVSLPDGDYRAFTWVPGMGEFKENLTVSGSAASVAFDFSAIEIETVTVTVTNAAGSPMNGVYVDAFDPANDRYSSGFTNSSGVATLQVVSGTYEIRANAEDYISSSTTLNTASATTAALTLTAADATITGQVLDDVGSPVAYTWVDAQSDDGGWAGTLSDGLGNYSLPVSEGNTWEVVARDPQGSWGTEDNVLSDATNVDITMNQSLTHFVAEDPFNTSIDPTQDNVLTDDLAELTAGAGAFGDDSNGVSVEFSKTTAVPATDSAEPLGGFGIDITANDSLNNGITQLTDDVTIEVKYDKAQVEALVDNSIITVDGLDAPLAYFNENNDAWVVVSGSTLTVQVQENVGDSYVPVEKATFFDNYDTYAAYEDFVVSYSGTVDHLTVFAPIVSGDSTAPSAPGSLTATGSTGQVVLDWSDNAESDLLEYEVYRSTSSTVTKSDANQINTSSVTASTFTDTTVTNGTTYYYAVSAVDTAGNESSLSSTANVTPGSSTTTVNTSSGTIAGGSSNGYGSASSSVSEEVAEVAEEAATEESSETNDETTESTEEAATESTAEAATESGALINDFEATDYEDHWAEAYIDTVVQAGIAQGIGENRFDPDTTVTRAQLVKMVVNAIGYGTPVYLSESPFSDVEADAWYAPYIEVGKERGILEGYEDGTFRPDQAVTRAEALKIVIEGGLGEEVLLDSSQGLLGSFNLTENPFSDVELNAWYAQYVFRSYSREIVTGYGDGTFGPDNSMTRAEFSKILVKALDL